MRIEISLRNRNETSSALTRSKAVKVLKAIKAIKGIKGIKDQKAYKAESTVKNLKVFKGFNDQKAEDQPCHSLTDRERETLPGDGT